MFKLFYSLVSIVLLLLIVCDFDIFFFKELPYLQKYNRELKSSPIMKRIAKRLSLLLPLTALLYLSDIVILGFETILTLSLPIPSLFAMIMLPVASFGLLTHRTKRKVLYKKQHWWEFKISIWSIILLCLLTLVSITIVWLPTIIFLQHTFK